MLITANGTFQPRLLKKVFISFSIFHHLLPSMRGVNPENFSFIAITNQILCSFKVWGIFVNFVIFDFLLIFRGLPIGNTFSSSLHNDVTLITTQKCFEISQTHSPLNFLESMTAKKCRRQIKVRRQNKNYDGKKNMYIW